VTPELQEQLFRPSSSMTEWENYVAHGLSWPSRAPAAHILGEDGYYRLTELGKVMANRVVDPGWRAKMEQRVDEAIAAMTAEKERPVDGDHQIS
jgi:hypothetical protein